MKRETNQEAPATKFSTTDSPEFSEQDKADLREVLENEESKALLLEMFRSFSEEDFSRISGYLKGTDVSPENETLLRRFLEAVRKRLEVLEFIEESAVYWRTLGLERRSARKPSLDDYDARRERYEDGRLVPHKGHFGIYQSDNEKD